MHFRDPIEELMIPKLHSDSTDSKKLLKAFNSIYGRRQTVEALLLQATRIMVELLEVKCCMITWLTADKGIMEVVAASYRSASGDIDETIVTNDSRTAKVQEFWESWQEGQSFQKGRNAKKLIAPIRVNGEIVGNICIPDDAVNNCNSHPINTGLYSTISAHVGFALELQHLRQMLANQYPSEQSTLDYHIFQAARKPEHVAKIIARSFYKHLRKAGFETKQILIVASEIIENLNKTLLRTKAKTADFATEVSDKH
jgi:hypothetical protein